MLDWVKFKSLPGLDADNYEKLCRSIVRRRFGRYGPLIELKNQPGVEFYIQLNQDCSELGSFEDKVGWQCKWFAKRANGELTSSSRQQVLHSLKTTNEHVSDLTRWILWTPFTLAKSDQDWFYGLQSIYSYQLELWNADDIENCLEGPALELKATYFGDLALTPEALEQQHRESVASIQERWIKEVHQQVNVEKEIRKLLGETAAWNEFLQISKPLTQLCKIIKKFAVEPTYIEWTGELMKFANACTGFASLTDIFKQNISGKDIELIHGMQEYAEAYLDTQVYNVLRQIRRQNLSLAIDLTNAIAFIKDIKYLLEDVSDCLSISFAAVLADAGGGKTQMAAEITGPQPDRPAGILLHGRQLRKGDSLDNLAQKISFYGRNVPNFSALISALDAAAYRANCRLPIVIDGLNEAEIPQEWKPLLATALIKLENYPNVLLVCTLRTGERKRQNTISYSREKIDNRETFAQMSLPEDCILLECEGFSDLTRQAVFSYFQYYKIEADLSQIPQDFFNHPLNLRIFCEVTNRNAEQVVKVDHFPASITTLFKNQIEYAAKRISELPNLNSLYDVNDVLKTVYLLGIELWKSGKRSVSEDKFLDLYNLKESDWNRNIVNLLAQEGIIFRDPGDAPYSYVITPVYDRLGGCIIADALLKLYQNDDDANWAKEQCCIDLLFGDRDSSHQLSQDIVHSLVALMPNVLSKQFWMVVPDTYKSHILELSTLIDADDFCSETTEAYRKQVLSCKVDSRIFIRLKKVRTIGKHPLNAEFFNSFLKELSMPDRDLSWSEFLRTHRNDVLKETQNIENRWKVEGSTKTEGDRLLAQWLSWNLTSTCLDIRDLATEALYWYGRGATRELFEMTVKSLSINDTYVPERMLAASYGVAIYLACKSESPDDIEWLADHLYKMIFSKSANFSTTHLLAREYASKLIELVSEISKDKFTPSQLVDSKGPFPSMQRMQWNEKTEESRVFGSKSPFRMDFENYTIGRLTSERRNYDYDNPIYKEIRLKILWRIEDLGWNSAQFFDVEQSIESETDRYYGRLNRGKTERYGKKYSWIAYYEMAGQLLDEDKLNLWDERRFAVDIDPSFPTSIVDKTDDSHFFLGTTDIDTSDWIKNSPIPDVNIFTLVDTIDEIKGPWILLDGHISEEAKSLDRNLNIDARAYFLPRESSEKLINYYKNLEHGSISRPDSESTGYMYIGEIYQKKMNQIKSEGEFRVTVGKKIRPIETPVIKYNRNDDGAATISFNSNEFVDIEEPVNEHINAQLPIAEYSWESDNSSITRTHSKILTPNFFEKLKLVFDPTSIQYTDSTGTIAVKNISYKGSGYSNHRSIFYIRKDLLMKFMSDEQLELVWCINGERRLVNMENFHSEREGKVPYVDFSFCQLLDK